MSEVLSPPEPPKKPTFDGYTLAQLIRALRSLGLLA